MIPIQSQAHWLVAQPKTQPIPVKKLAFSVAQRIYNETQTSGIANKGYNGIRRVIVHFNVACNLIGNRPQFLIGNITYRCRSFKMTTDTHLPHLQVAKSDILTKPAKEPNFLLTYTSLA